MIPLLLLLAACSPDAGSVPSASAAAVAPSLQTAAVKLAPYRRSAEVTGSLEPIASVQLGFDVPGRIDALLVERGQSVKAGQPIARLDSRIAAAQLAQAKAALAGAEAQLAAGEAGFARAQKMKEAGGMSDQQFADAEAGIRAGRAGVEQARAAVQLASTHFANHTLKAPIDGVVTNGPDNAGVLVGAGTPVFLIEDLSALQVKGSVAEADAWLHEGMEATARAGAPGAEASVPARVVRVIPALDMMTRRLPVEIRIDGQPQLRAHSLARVTITDSEDITAAVVPRSALIARPDFCVFVTDASGTRRVSVAVLEERGAEVVVRGELADGATVVLSPPPSLVEG